jgi:hypothetical protein
MVCNEGLTSCQDGHSTQSDAQNRKGTSSEKIIKVYTNHKIFPFNTRLLKDHQRMLDLIPWC